MPDNALFLSCCPFRRGIIESDIFLCSTDLLLFSNPYVADKVNNLYYDITTNKITKEWILSNFYSLEVLWLLYMKKINIEFVRLQYFQFKDYDIIRNVEEYGKISNNKDVATLKSIHIKNNKLRKLIINILKIFPYFLVGNKIDKLNKLINTIFELTIFDKYFK